MTVAEIEERLRDFSRKAIDTAAPNRAAVSLALADGEHGPEFLIIQRATRAGDPWSGQMALPGGRYQAGDADALATALRETREETGIDLAAAGDTVGALDDLQAIGRGRTMDLVITPFVHAVRGPRPEAQIDPREVQTAMWVPVRALVRPDAQVTYRYQVGDGHFDAPAIDYRGFTIWGLTYRILTQLLTVSALSADAAR